MQPALSRTFAKMGGTVKSFTVAQRTIAIIGVAILVLGTVALTSWLAKPNYAPLFSGLAAADASQIVTQLKTDNVPYQLSNGGSTILVPDANVYDERLKAASAGLPAATAGGYSLLDTMGVTSSEFQQSVTYKRAMEGELAKTIMAMKGIKNASVKLAIPEKTVFAATTTDPTASVFIETVPGVGLTSDQVNAVVHLTSSAVDGLKPANVSVVDSSGAVLSAVGGGTGAADAASTEYEKRVGNSVQAMLDRVLGAGNATVSINAQVQKSSSDVVKESFSVPTGSPALNESTSTESTNGGTGTGAGVLGPDNIAVPGGAAGGGTSQSSKTTKNNAVNKTTENTTVPAGDLVRQSVSVAVNSAAAGQVDAATLTDLVSSAAGISLVRGDTVALRVVPFSTASADAAKAALAASEAEANAAATAQTWQTIIIAASIGLLLALAAIIYARKNRRQRRDMVDLGERDAGLSALDPLPVMPSPATMALPAIPEPVALPAMETTDSDTKRASIDALAATDPAKTAALLRSLMDERVGA